MHFRFSFVTLILLIHHTAHAAKPRLYWAPFYISGGITSTDNMPISSDSTIAIYSLHYQISKNIGTNMSYYGFDPYETKSDANERYNRFETTSFYGVVQYSPAFLKKHLFSRKLRGYFPMGLWYTHTQEPRIQSGNIEPSHYFYKGAGVVVGIGVYHDLFTRLSLDISWKKLVPLSILERDEHTAEIKGSHQFNIGFMIKLI